MNRDPSQEGTGALTCWEVAESTSVYLDAQFDESSHARLADTWQSAPGAAPMSSRSDSCARR